jgi:type II secretory pathway pseudopilin PulG
MKGRSQRRGFSLIEVIIATAILMGSAIVLAKLAGMGREQSQKAAIHSTAQQLCEQTMNELLLGLRPTELVELTPLIPLPRPVEEINQESVPDDPFASRQNTAEPIPDEANPEWRHSVRMEFLPELPGMWALTVVVLQGDETLLRPVRFELTRRISGPPPEGAFDELAQGADDETLLPQEIGP